MRRKKLTIEANVHEIKVGEKKERLELALETSVMINHSDQHSFSCKKGCMNDQVFLPNALLYAFKQRSLANAWSTMGGGYESVLSSGTHFFM